MTARPDPNDHVVIDSATGEWLPGAPAPALIRAGRGHAWQMAPGIWRLAEPDEDDEDARYTAVVVRYGRSVCMGADCTRTAPIMGVSRYVCYEHVADFLRDRDFAPTCEGMVGPATSGVDKSTGTGVVSSHQADHMAGEATRGLARRKEPDMSGRRATAKDGAAAIAMLASEGKSRPMTKRERIASGRTIVRDGMAAILAGTATADDVLADVAAVVPEAVPDPTPDPTPVTSAGAVLITMEERDRILAGKDKALIARVDAGVYVRPNGKVPSWSIKSTGTDARYYPRWRLAVSLTASQRAKVETVEADGGWGWTTPTPRTPRTTIVTESAPHAPALPAPEKATKVRKAKAVLDVIDALPGPEAIAAIGTPEAQDALEVMAAASLGRTEGDES